MANRMMIVPDVGVAARYSAQIRELLALQLNLTNARRIAEAAKSQGPQVETKSTGEQRAIVDVRV